MKLDKAAIDLIIIASALLSAFAIFAWLFYLRHHQNRDVKKMTHVLRQGFWVRSPYSEKYVLDIRIENESKQRGIIGAMLREPHTAHDTFMAFLDRHIILGRTPDSGGDHQERDQRQ